MAYQSNIPKPKDIKSQSQGDMLNNFVAIDEFVSVDHVEFDDTDEGKHNKLTLVAQDDAPSTGSTETALYCKRQDDDTASLFFREESDGTELDLLLTDEARLNTNGWAKMPGGILWAWGVITGVDSSSSTSPTPKTFTFVDSIEDFPGFSAVYSCLVTTSTSSTLTTGPNVLYNSFSTTNIVVRASSGGSRYPSTVSASFLVIGAY